MTEPYVFGPAAAGLPAAAQETADDVSFDGVSIGRGGYPQERAPYSAPAAAPPPAAVPAAALPTPVGATATSDLDELFAELGRSLDLDDVALPVPTRPRWSCRYRLLLDATEMQPWRRDAYDPSILEGIDEIKLACLALAGLNTGLLLDGRPALGADGHPLTFQSPEIISRLRADDPAHAVKLWYAVDAHTAAAWATVKDESGFGTVLLPVEHIGRDQPAPPHPS